MCADAAAATSLADATANAKCGAWCCVHNCVHNKWYFFNALCSEYVATIQRFVETRRAYEWGLVAQALAGAMRHVLQVGPVDSHMLQG